MLVLQLALIIMTLIWMRVIIIATKSSNSHDHIDASNSNIFILPILLTLLLVTVFRSPGTGVDYVSYLSINNTLAAHDWSEIWSIPYIQMEPLLLTLMKLLSHAQLGLIPFLFVTTLATIYVYYKVIRKDSKIVWLSVLLLLSLVGYFTIFNTVAQIFVALLMFAASTFIYNAQWGRYIIAVLAVALVHKTALFMLPMYWLLRYRPRSKSELKWVLSAGIILFAITLTFIDDIVLLGAKYFFPEYINTINELPSVSALTVIKPLAILAFVTLHIKQLRLNNTKERVWFNSIIFSTALSILAVEFGLLQRFTYFLLPYVTLIIPLIISRIEPPKRLVYLTGAVLFMLVYVVSTNIASPLPYSFLWIGRWYG